MIHREFTAERLNEIVNHPSVFPWVKMPGQTSLDLTPAVEDRDNVLLVADGCAFFFTMHEVGVYEVHSQVLPEHRGQGAVKALRAAFYWMFTASPCMEILTKVPVYNRAASLFARKAGGIFEFTRPNAWPTDKGLVDVEYYALRYNDWIKTAEGLPELGEQFHVRLKAGMRASGYPEAEHPDDPAHDRYVGACYAQVAAGQTAKAVVLYNRWARFCDHAPISMISRDILDVGNVFLRLQCALGDEPPPEGAWDFEVLPCPSVQ